jgi:hypothetical protein
VTPCGYVSALRRAPPFGSLRPRPIARREQSDTRCGGTASPCPVDWEQVRADRRHGVPAALIAEKHGLTIGVVYEHTLDVPRETSVQARRTSRYPLLNDAPWLRVQLALGRSLRSIAQEIGCDNHNIPRWLRRHGIDVPPPSMPRLERIAALVDPVERARAAEVVEAEARAEANAARRIKTRAHREVEGSAL